MPWQLEKGVWRNKPPVGTQINWGNTLLNKFKSILIMNEGGGVLRDLLLPPSYNISHTQSWDSGAINFAGTNDRITLNATGFNATYPSTFIFKVYLLTALEQGCFVNFGLPNSPTYGGIGIGVGDAANFDTTTDTGNNLIILYNAKRWIPTGVDIGIGWHTIAVSINASGQPKAYIDGKHVFTDAGAAPGQYEGNYYYLGGYLDGTSDRYVRCKMDWYMFAQSELSASEIQSISINPYQIFEQRRFWWTSGAAAASYIKTVQGLAKASNKTVQGLAIASVKTIEGLS